MADQDNKLKTFLFVRHPGEDKYTGERINQEGGDSDFSGHFYSVQEVDDVVEQLKGTLLKRTARLADCHTFTKLQASRLNELIDKEADYGPCPEVVKDAIQKLNELENRDDDQALRVMMMNGAKNLVEYGKKIEAEFYRAHPEHVESRKNSTGRAIVFMELILSKFAKMLADGDFEVGVDEGAARG